MGALPSDQRRALESTVVQARRAAESASRASLIGLGVFEERKPSHLDADRAELRVGLRAKSRQLGWNDDLLVSECAYEQWHRLLFARFLIENNLLLHPRFKVPVSLEECAELADELDEPDAWSVAARFAAEILPGIFRLEDPCVRVRLAPEGRHELESIVDSIASEVFAADDALGWVYQFWQKDKKDEINASERKIGGADLGPVTQLFTENYMVRFLLENSLGAWWAARRPESPLVSEFEYLRFDDDGRPAAGEFEEWPKNVAEVTVMDPCCGSGHFLVEAFSMLWKMRMEEEGTIPTEAQDAVLRDNLFGLELDPRCVQIAMFSVVLQAWKSGGGWRELPVPNISCSGIPVKATAEEWKALASGDQRLGRALDRLHGLFRDADTLGSLIDLRRAIGDIGARGSQASLEDVDWEEVVPLVEAATGSEAPDPAMAILGGEAAGMVRAAESLSRQYILVCTNVPFLGRGRQSTTLREFIDLAYTESGPDLAGAVSIRANNLTAPGGTTALVSPEYWLFLDGFRGLREYALSTSDWRIVALLGSGAFETIGGEVVRVCLTVTSQELPTDRSRFVGVDAGQSPRSEKPWALQTSPAVSTSQSIQLRNPNNIVILGEIADGAPLGDFVNVYPGTQSGDDGRYRRFFWEMPVIGGDWTRFRTGIESSEDPFTGMSCVARWDAPDGLVAAEGSVVRGSGAWDAIGCAISRSGDLNPGLHDGSRFSDSVAVLVPINENNLAAIWSYVSSPDFAKNVRRLNRKLLVANSVFAQVPFDFDRWNEEADRQPATAIPGPHSSVPTQWPFDGTSCNEAALLQFVVGQVLGYMWPAQEVAAISSETIDRDGIVCLPPVAGEPDGGIRVNDGLTELRSGEWSPKAMLDAIRATGSKKETILDWLRDDFFGQHCALFANRPYIWHIWDGRKDGFSVLVNYHKFDRKALEKLTYTYLGQDWVERQRAASRDGAAGADARLEAALELQKKLEAILEGEPPYDIYVRWKSLHEQPIGWEPDLDDGVRLNIRPFVEAGVLRSKMNVHWRKDRGKDPDGSERINDLHFTVAEKLLARREAGL